MKRIEFCALVFLTLTAVEARAIDRLSVDVVCQLAEARYRLSLTTGQIDQIETDCGSQLADLLGNKFKFLQFASGTGSPNQLIMRIGKSAEEVDFSAFRPVNIEAWVEGDNVAGRGETVTWTFRTVDEFLRVPTAETFADDITLRFAVELENIQSHLVQAQLSRLMIANSAFPMPQDKSWLLPFTREELGVGYDTILKIKATLQVADGTERFVYEVELFGDFLTATEVPSVFHNKVKALHLGDDKLARAESLKRLENADDVEVLHVSVSRYVPLSAPDRTSPSGLELDGDTP